MLIRDPCSCLLPASLGFHTGATTVHAYSSMKFSCSMVVWWSIVGAGRPSQIPFSQCTSSRYPILVRPVRTRGNCGLWKGAGCAVILIHTHTQAHREKERGPFRKAVRPLYRPRSNEALRSALVAVGIWHLLDSRYACELDCAYVADL